MSGEWKTIESAPKEPFARLFLWCESESVHESHGLPARFVTVGYWTNEDSGWVTADKGIPTHWMPLPPPPTQGTEAK